MTGSVSPSVKFRLWLERLYTRGLTDDDACRLLHCGRASITRWKWREPPFYIGLAISALEAGLPPYKTAKR